MLFIRFRYFFFISSGFYLVSSKCNKSTSAQLEEELREMHVIALNNLTLYDGGDILNWNCSDKENQSSQEDQAESKVNPVMLTDPSSNSDVIGTIFGEKTSYPSSYALVYRNIFDSRKDESSAPSSNIPVNISVEESTTVRSDADGETSTQLAQSLNTALNNQGSMDHRENRNYSFHQDQSETKHDIPVNILLGEKHGITILNATYPQNSVFLNLTNINIFSVDYKFESGIIVFAGNGTIRSTGEPSVVVSAGAGAEGPVRLAVDWVHDRVYWLSDTHQTVEAVNLDGANRTLITDAVKGIKYPNNIAVDPYQRLIFFVANDTIYRSDINSINLTIIKHRDVGQSIRCLALDLAAKRLFFSGKVENISRKSYIASSDYAGDHMKYHDIGQTDWNDIYGMSVFREVVYFTHYNPPLSDSVWFFNTSWTGKRPAKVYEAPVSRGGIWSITVWHPEIQEQSTKLGG